MIHHWHTLGAPTEIHHCSFLYVVQDKNEVKGIILAFMLHGIGNLTNKDAVLLNLDCLVRAGVWEGIVHLFGSIQYQCVSLDVGDIFSWGASRSNVSIDHPEGCLPLFVSTNVGETGLPALKVII